jgi:hypothetical protein
MGYHDVAQICLNGHTITRNARGSPEFTKKFCSTCGERAIMACDNCDAPIRGEYHADGVVFLSASIPAPPAFCDACGKPFPWTQRKVDAAKALAEELDELSSDEKTKLRQSIDELSSDSTQTEVAAVRFKKIMAKVGKESFAAMRKIVVDVLSEAAKKSIFGP